MKKHLSNTLVACVVFMSAIAGSVHSAMGVHPDVINSLPEIGLGITLVGDQFVIRGQDTDDLTFAGPRQPFDDFRGPTLPGLSVIARETTSSTFARSTESSWEDIGGETLATLGAPDLAMAIQESTSVTASTGFRQNSPVSQIPYIRGFRGGQIYTVSDGQQWVSARPDLDSPLSRIDPSLIKDVLIINGPYGLRYGPGFSFIDVQTFDSPRYFNGFESHARVGTSFRTNGGQIFGRTTAFGGSSDWGFVLSYNDRAGSDYSPGGNSDLSKIPSSYRVQDYLGQIGVDLSSELSAEFRFKQIYQNDTEYAAQFFDISELPTSSYNLALNYDSACQAESHRLEAWYNRSYYLGDTLSPSKHDPRYPVIQRVDQALATRLNTTPDQVNFEGDTDGDIASTGARFKSTYGDEEWVQLNLGADARYIQQHLYEQFTTNLGALGYPALENIETNMPRASMVDPGIFAEVTAPLLGFLTTSVGGRIDYVHTDAESSPGFPDGLRPNTSLIGAPDNFSQDDMLYAFYIRNDIDLTSNSSLNLSAGYAERAPTLLERYADGIMLGILQNGFTRTIGRPDLKKEGLWQLDATLQADYDSCRGSVSGYYAWINDFITYEGYLVDDPTDARLLRSVNGNQATLAGVDVKGELDLTNQVSAIGTISYVEGSDHWTDRPLVGIVPLESRIAMRLHDSDKGAVWGLEGGACIVDDQDRVGALRRLDGSIDDNFEKTTPGFTTFFVRGYWNVTEDLYVTAGVDNLFDRTYIEHLNIRLPEDATYDFPWTPVLSQGISPYINIELTY